MTTHTAHLKAAYQRTGLSFLGIIFERAMATTVLRISLECAVKAQNKGKLAPVQPALI